MSNKARAHLSRDPVFRKIIQSTRLRRRVFDGDIYGGLVRAIIFQQLSTKAARTIYQRFLGLFDDGYPHADDVLRLSADQAATAGLSRQKNNYVRNVASFWSHHRLDEQQWELLSDDEIVERLTQIKGVGTWTAQMILMFTLNRPDVFPIGDLGIRTAIVKRYRLRSKGPKLDRRLLTIANQWRPHRTLACRYLWDSLDQQ